MKHTLRLNEKIYECYILEITKDTQMQVGETKGIDYLIKNYNNILENDEDIKNYLKYEKITKERQYVYYLEDGLFNKFDLLAQMKYKIKGIVLLRILIYKLCCKNYKDTINEIYDKFKDYNKFDVIFKFSEEISLITLSKKENMEIINNIDNFLDKHNLIKFNLLKKNKKEQFYTDLIQLYKMIFKTKYSMYEISKCCNKSERMLEMWINDLTWKLDVQEWQQRAADRLRNYKEIRNKGRRTIQNDLQNGKQTKPEEYLRNELNTLLPIVFKNYEVIVGLNNISILDDGNELDVPIIIINKDKIYKYAIEYNGSYWHKNEERDINKLKMTQEKGYKLFYIAPKKNASTKQIKEFIDENIQIIIKQISIDTHL